MAVLMLNDNDTAGATALTVPIDSEHESDSVGLNRSVTRSFGHVPPVASLASLSESSDFATKGITATLVRSLVVE